MVTKRKYLDDISCCVLAHEMVASFCNVSVTEKEAKNLPRMRKISN